MVKKLKSLEKDNKMTLTPLRFSKLLRQSITILHNYYINLLLMNQINGLHLGHYSYFLLINCKIEKKLNFLDYHLSDLDTP